MDSVEGALEMMRLSDQLRSSGEKVQGTRFTLSGNATWFCRIWKCSHCKLVWLPTLSWKLLVYENDNEILKCLLKLNEHYRHLHR